MPKLNLRLPEAMRRKLERAANRNGRSMQTEILHRLEMSFIADAGAEAGRKAAESDTLDERLQEMEARILRKLKGEKL